MSGLPDNARAIASGPSNAVSTSNPADWRYSDQTSVAST